MKIYEMLCTDEPVEPEDYEVSPENLAKIDQIVDALDSCEPIDYVLGLIDSLEIPSYLAHSLIEQAKNPANES